MAEGIKIGSTFAGYRVDSVLGRGGMGVVFLAEQAQLGRSVAIKVIAPELASDEVFRERFSREARLAASIEHPNAIPIYEAGVQGTTPYLVMRYVDGVDLSSLIAGGSRLSADRACAIIAQVAGALDEAHHRGLVHRDVKPANVLVESRRGTEHAYLTDFGLTKQADALTGMTATGRWVGTIDYASPEQIRGKRVDARADVYSLGCVLFATLTGRVPFEREADVAKLYAHISDPPPLVSSLAPGLPGELDWVVNRALAKDPDERFQSAGDLGRAASAALSGERAAKAERTVATGAAAPDEHVSLDDVAAPTPPSEPVPPMPPADGLAPTVAPGAPASAAADPASALTAAEQPSGAPAAEDASEARKSSVDQDGPEAERPRRPTPADAATRRPVSRDPKRRSRAPFALMLAALVAAVAAYAVVKGDGAGSGSDPGGGSKSGAAARSKLDPQTLQQPTFTVQVPGGIELPGKNVTETLETAFRTELVYPDGINVQIVREKAPRPPAKVIGEADDKNSAGAAAAGSVYEQATIDPAKGVRSEGDPAIRYSYLQGRDRAGVMAIVNYAFVRGGQTWRTRAAVTGGTANNLERADEIATLMATTLKPD